MQQYEQALRDNAIDTFVLSELTAEDLKDIGVDLVGHRRKLSPPFPHCAAALRRIRPRLRSASSVGSTRLSASDHLEATPFQRCNHRAPGQGWQRPHEMAAATGTS